jgi:hypothetical protein
MHGNITGYTISVSDDKRRFQQVASGTWPADSTYKIAEWSPAASGRYVRLQATSANGNDSVVINEIAVGGRTHTPTTTPVRVAEGSASRPKSSNHNSGIFITIGGTRPVAGRIPPAHEFDMAGRTMQRAAADGPFPYTKKDGAFVFKAAELQR